MSSKHCLTLWITLALAVCFIVFALCFSSYKNKQIAFGNGYERQAIIGSEYPVWKKVR